MKKLKLLVSMLVFVLSIKAQPYLNLELFPKVCPQAGAGIQVGGLINAEDYWFDKVDIFMAFKAPITKNEQWKIVSVNIGRQILLTHEDEDNWSITPSIGQAYLYRKDYTCYYADRTGRTPIADIFEYHPIFNLEVGKDSYMGRVSLNAHYCTSMYVGISLKMFPYRPKK